MPRVRSTWCVAAEASTAWSARSRIPFEIRVAAALRAAARARLWDLGGGAAGAWHRRRPAAGPRPGPAGLGSLGGLLAAPAGDGGGQGPLWAAGPGGPEARLGLAGRLLAPGCAGGGVAAAGGPWAGAGPRPPR